MQSDGDRLLLDASAALKSCDAPRSAIGGGCAEIRRPDQGLSWILQRG
jgi:hypothetical protein